MHNMGKTISKLHAMRIEYEKGLPKKAETPQVMMIKGGKIQKAKKKSLKAKGKGKANGKGKDKQCYIPKPKNPKPSAKKHPAKDDTCHHCKEGFREARKLKQGALYLSGVVEALVKRDSMKKLQQRSVKFVEEYNEFFEEKSHNSRSQWEGHRSWKEIQDDDASPSEITSKIPMEVEGFEPLSEEEILIRRGSNEPTSYKATMLDSVSNKWIDAMNAKITSHDGQYGMGPGRSSSWL
ncbi:hypothetical protein Tco_1057237 [Tanacetum coccineum]|uniref:Uncharacterized protein n=1 Tax=Tanacetum coccineum TaxID=301880 RepID=A0ABQ5H4T3_9ASTR